MLVPNTNVQKVDVGDQNGQNRHQHISSPTSVTNVDITSVSAQLWSENQKWKWFLADENRESNKIQKNEIDH